MKEILNKQEKKKRCIPFNKVDFVTLKSLQWGPHPGEFLDKNIMALGQKLGVCGQ